MNVRTIEILRFIHLLGVINFIKANSNKTLQHNIVLRLNKSSKTPPTTDDSNKFNIYFPAFILDIIVNKFL